MNRRNRIVAIASFSGLERLLLLALFALLGLGAALPAHAQAQAQALAPAGDPPGRAARLSDISGQVWLFSQDDNEWVAIDRNRPLTTGDRIATDNDARAEITLGTTTLRLDAATELEIGQLDDSNYRVRLFNGSVAARLRSPQSLAEFALETDDGRFRVQTVGRYRFDRFDQGSDLTVYAGQAIYEAGNNALPLTTGQHAQFWLDAGGAPQYNMVEPARDDFAAWNDGRDRAESRPVAAVRYVSPDMTGADDLDRYGQWEQSPDYGPLWTPANVAVDWAPYSAGHWAWVRPWGWTWVDAAPWGFAPFHYGRWVNYRNRWCWAPGTYVARPVYAPALVAWIGGPRVGVSLSIGSGGPPVGWFPLAPHEVYVPSYRASPRYLREVNVTHVTNVVNITTIVNNVNGAADHREFANRRFPNAVTVVPAGVLTGRQPVGPAAAQWRGNPEVRALVAESRPGPAMNAPPVAAPPARPRIPEGQAPRPPFQARTPGAGFAARPSGEARPAIGGRPEGRVGERQGIVTPPSAGTPTPVMGGATARPMPASPAGRPAQAGGPPDIARPDLVRPAQPAARPSGEAIERPPVRGRILREPGADARVPGPSSQRVAPTAEAARPAVVPRGEMPTARPAESRGAEAQRPVAPPGGEAMRAAEVVRPEAVPRGAEPQRALPDGRVQRPEAPRREERRDEKRDPKEQSK